MKRCVNIDWLECYCLEDSIGYPHNADYFRSRGWEVREREYGTPMYQEMFTLIDVYGEPFCEVRRAPKSDNLRGGIFDPASAHVRLCNRACYNNYAARNLSLFLEQYGFAYQRISRIDICLDFERFDYGDDPQVFLKRFVAGRYAKINQANICLHGLDMWDGRAWNSVKWGAPKSMVTTRLYNKTMELQQVKDKPYIRQAWQLSGLVDDWQSLEKRRRDGSTYKPVIWRVEFAVKSGTNNWMVIEDYNGDRKRIRSLRNDLNCYMTREKVFDVFLSLAHHYFHFKHVEYKDRGRQSVVTAALSAITCDPMHPLTPTDSSATRELQRKDRCADKPLFRKSDLDTYYKFERKTLSSTPRNAKLDSLLRQLYAYRDRQYDTAIRNACNVLIAKLETETRISQLAAPFDPEEIELLRRVLSEHLRHRDVSVSETFRQVKDMFNIERTLWKEQNSEHITSNS